MGTIHIRDGLLSASIEPEIGAGLSELALEVKGRPCDLLRPGIRATRFTDLSMYLMAPWTNRIAGAAFEFGGKTHRLQPDWADGSAIHGDVKTRRWNILDRTPLSARLGIDSREFKDSNWPWPYTAEVRYEIDGSAFRMEMAVRNQGDTPMPAGLGFHPFFSRSPRKMEDDAVRIKVVTRGRYPLKNMSPSGPARADEVTERLCAGGELADLKLDDVFAGLEAPAVVSWPGVGIEAEMECSQNLAHAVVYSPRGKNGVEPWFCIEPVSMVTHGFNAMSRGVKDTGVVILEPGQWLRCSAAIHTRVLGKN